MNIHSFRKLAALRHAAVFRPTPTLPALLLLAPCLPLSAADFSPASNWMKNGVLGLDLTGRDMTNFNLARFADQCADMGVTFVCCGIGQNSGSYNGPNPVYENIAGYPVGSKCDPADIPAQFLQELAPRGMRMFLYIPSNPPESDAQARNHFLWPGTGYVTPSLATQNLWTLALQGWSDHYGPALAGWWFDGAYSTGAYDFANLYGPRVKSGNANRMVCFNNGPGVRRVSTVETMTAGEMNSMHLLPRSRWVGGAQWFTYTYAGDSWNLPISGHYSQQFLTDYLGGLRERGGVMMLNVKVDDFGNVDPATYARLVQARKALRDKNAKRRVLRNSTGLSGVVYGGSGWRQETGRDYSYWQPGYSGFVRRASLNEDTMKTDVNGAWAEYTFQGSGVSYFGDRGGDKGEVDVYLNDVFQQRIHCGGTEKWLQHLWSVSGLPKGTHRLKLVKVSGSWMEVDAFAVENPVVNPAVIPPSQMSASASSEQPGGGEASLVLDEDTTTNWHNLFTTPTTLPQSITLGLGGLYPIQKLRYLPRRDGGNGVITAWRIATSLDGITFTDVLTGTWASNTAEKTAIFPTVPARYIRLTATAGINGFASAAEIRIEKDLSAVDPLVIDPATISITASSEQTNAGSAFLAADGDPNSNWRIRSGTVTDVLPQHVLFDLVEVTDVRRLRYLPPQQGTAGIITTWNLSASTDGKVFTPVASGNWAADASLKTIDFTTREARFLKFEATAGTGGTAAAAELTVERAPVPTVTCPASQEIPMNTPSHSFVASVGELVATPETLTLTAVSSNPDLIPNSGIVVSGTGAHRTVSFTPSPYRHGSAAITLTVDNGDFSSTAECVVNVLPIAPPPTTSGIIRESTELWYDFNNPNKNVREALSTDASGNNRGLTSYIDPGNKWGPEGSIIVSDNAAGWSPDNAFGLPADDYQLVMQVNEPLPNWPFPHGDMDIANYDGIRIGYDNGSTYTASVGGTLLASHSGSGLWVKLVKLGGNLSFLTSPDGQSWTQRGTEVSSDAGSNWGGLHIFIRPGGGYHYWGYFGDLRVDRIFLQQTWSNQSGNRLWSPWVHNWSSSEWSYWKGSFATDALFGTEGAGPITVTEPLHVRNITFSAPGYELSGEKLMVPNSTITASSDVTIRNPIDGSGSLTKSGIGTLTLAGAITCPGNITVVGGSLVLASGASVQLSLTSSGHNRVTGPGSLQIHGALVIDTSALSAPAVGSQWQLVDTASRSFAPTFQVEGFTPLGDGIHWLKPAGGLNQWVFSESTGALALEVSDYATWIDTAGLTSAVADEDHDGVNNFAEYAFGLDPKSGASSRPVTLQSTASLRYTRRNPALTRLTYTVWHSTNLNAWQRDTGASQSVFATNGDVQTIDVSPSPGLLAAPKVFFQIRAE
jgi:autotransporter-associated beta strand protein